MTIARNISNSISEQSDERLEAYSGDVQFSESFARIACLAALELEQIAAKQKNDRKYIAKFVNYILSNMNFNENTSSYVYKQDVEPFSIDISTAYAVNAALGNKKIDNNAEQNLNEFAEIIKERITDPLSKIMNEDFNALTYVSIQSLSDLCLSISKSYSSLECRFDVFDTHPYK